MDKDGKTIQQLSHDYTLTKSEVSRETVRLMFSLCRTYMKQNLVRLFIQVVSYHCHVNHKLHFKSVSRRLWDKELVAGVVIVAVIAMVVAEIFL